MTTNKLKEKVYIVMTLLLVPIMIISSLLVNFNMMDAFYLIVILGSAIYYFRCK